MRARMPGVRFALGGADLTMLATDETRRHRPWTPRHLAQELEDLITTRQIKPIVERLLATNASVVNCVEAHRHPNGFTKIRLASWRNGLSLSLHLWPGNMEPGDIHSHRWNFASSVMGGTLINTCYLPQQGSDWVAYRCTPDVVKRRYDFRALALVDLTVADKISHARDVIYEQPLHLLHTAMAGNMSSATTLMLQGPSEAKSSTVLLYPNTPTQPAKVQQLPAAEILSALEVLEDRLCHA